MNSTTTKGQAMFKHNPNSLGDAHEAITKVSNQLSRGLINPSDAYAQFLRILIDFKMETLHDERHGHVHAYSLDSE